MGHALELFFDPTTEAAVKDVWARLETAGPTWRCCWARRRRPSATPSWRSGSAVSCCRCAATWPTWAAPPTHKAAVIRLYLQGLTTPDIAARTHHTKQAVDRYLQGYERLRLLAAKFAPEELPLRTGRSQGLIDQYLALLDEHGADHHRT